MADSLFTIETETQVFFDRDLVTKHFDRQTARMLSRFGAFVRRTAQRSIRTDRTKAQKPAAEGQPPKSRKGYLREGIQFAADLAKRSVVIGVVPFSGRPPIVPRALEFGGESVVRKKSGKRKATAKLAKIGGGGPIRLGGPAGAATKDFTGRTGGTLALTFCKLVSAAQVERANRLWDLTSDYGTTRKQRQKKDRQQIAIALPDGASINIRPHPYMRPAFDKELQKMPDYAAGLASA